MRLLAILLALAAHAQVVVRFDPTRPDVGPFPTDFLTVPDSTQKTGLRVALPGQEGVLVNGLDGFNVQPRIAVRFSGAVNVDTLRAGIWYVALENLTNEEAGLQREGDAVAINQVIYDPATNTAYAKPDSALDQHRRYAIVVTDAVKDPGGAAAAPEAGFTWCVTSLPNDYCRSLARAVASAGKVAGKIVGGSVFTTMSATAWLEGARSALGSTNPSAARFTGKSVFNLNDLSSLTIRHQTGVNPDRYTDFPIPLVLFPSAGKIAFGTYQSPRFLDSRQMIPPAPTALPVQLPAATETIHFHSWLPASAKPAAGYPVVIFGHGITDNRFQGPSAVVPAFANAGLAVVALNAFGHGFGPAGRIVIRERSGGTTELPTGGRGVDLNADGTFEAREGCVIVTPQPVGTRDCLRQTVIDQMQLVRAIRGGLDVDGDGVPDFDPNRIYYLGQSLGAMYGTVFMAVEPNVGAGTLNSGGGSEVDITRWNPVEWELAALLNLPSVNDNYVLRYRPVKVNDVPGAIELQNFLEWTEWLQASGDPLSYAPHLKQSTLPGVPIKKILWQYPKGDRTVPNNTQSALVRAANMRETTWFYRHDLARAALPGLAENPHIYLLNILSLQSLPIALATQGQVAAFFTSDGTRIEDPNAATRSLTGSNLFEVPQFLTEELNW